MKLQGPKVGGILMTFYENRSDWCVVVHWMMHILLKWEES